MYHQNAHVNLHLLLSSEPSIFLSDEIFSEICNVSLAQDKYNCWIWAIYISRCHYGKGVLTLEPERSEIVGDVF